MTYIVVWKDTPGQLVSTNATKDGDVLHYDTPPDDAVVPSEAYDIYEHLETKPGAKLALTPQQADQYLGWDDI